MYSVLAYGRMAADGIRMNAYARAIAQAVRPGSIVVDLGSGPGVMSLLALRAGARRVHAIDTNPAVWLARDLAAENGFAGRLEVHHGSSFDVTLPEKGDVVVADLRGSSPLYERNLAAVADARSRLLAPGGALIPARDRLFVALVEADLHRRDLELGWSGIEQHGFVASAARTATVNSIYSDADAPLRAADLLSEPRVWHEVEYGAPSERTVTATVQLPVVRAGRAHALAMWFEATLADGIRYTNAPGDQLVYKRTLLPFPEPTEVAEGAVLHVTIRADVVGDQWAWDTQLAGGPRVRQATFLGVPTSQEALLKESLSATPARAPAGDRAARILGLMDGTRSVREIADAIGKVEPAARPDDVLDDVKSCVRRYGR